uniref:Uncharacterized protein n=1 Tax=Thermosporothrix sp. COM3 TaxID=2490863 RepID=A0A455STC8_9CHLR|nr:hypothetical protein KTC_64340 [Thermosporothrix sp. COM3]
MAQNTHQYQPSDELLEFLKETVRYSLHLVKHRQPELMTVRSQNEQIYIDVWSKDGSYIMSSATPFGKLPYLETIATDPEKRKKHFEFLASINP